MKKIDKYNNLRRKTAKYWDEWCNLSGYRKPSVIKNSTPVFLRYPVMVEAEKKQNRNWAMKNLGIDPGIWFISNVHPVTRDVVDCPNADIAVKKCKIFW